jgi:hypothetical protein
LPLKKVISFFFLVVLVFHLSGVFGILLRLKLGTNKPILTDDYSIRTANIYYTRIFFKNSKRLYGYSPYHMAGYPANVIFDVDSKAEEVFSLLFYFISPEEFLKIWFLIWLILTPYLIYISFLNFTSSKEISFLASSFSLIVFWQFPEVGFIGWGMYSTLFSFLLSFLALSYLYKYIKKEKIIFLILFSVYIFLSILFHIASLSSIFFSLVYLTFYIFLKSKNKNLSILKIVFFLSLPIFLNIFWLLPLYNFSSYIKPSGGEEGMFFRNRTFSYMYFSFLPLLPFRLYLIIFSIFGFFKIKDKLLLYVLMFGILPSFFLTYFSSYLNFPFLSSPDRFDWSLTLFLSIPSAFLFYKIIKKFKNLKIFKFSIFLFVVFCFFSQSYYPFILGRIFNKNFKDEKLFVPNTFLPDEGYKIIDWIKKNTNKKARILIEDSGEKTKHRYFKTHLLSLLPFYTKREYIGGPYPYIFDKHSFANYYEGKIFEKKLSEISISEFLSYIHLYNIKWIIYYSKESNKFFKKIKDYVIKKEKIGKFTFITLNTKPSFFIKGKGKIRAYPGKIFVSDFKGRIAILKYHYFPYFKTKPQMNLEKEFYLSDPIPFLKIKNPPKSFLIYN